MEKYKVVIPAAGQGKRMKAGKNKQFLLLDQVPLLIHTILVFEEDILCDGIILVINKDEFDDVKQLLLEFGIKKVEKLVVGGKERQQSVYEGLKSIEGDPIVLVHDGARPFIQIDKIHKLVSAFIKNGSATIGTPVKDTIKEVVDGKATKTVDRSRLWAIQTPQAFRHSQIYRAHQTAESNNYFGTDDASIMEYIGESVYIVEGDYENIKITTPEDLLFGEAIIGKRKGEFK
ncbi:MULTISPECIES: 2-C-methyl-D-erythritol 4-phosphate cytidylyltransferase [Bacillaceae]|uniref:2-C-methyl-D-erythritol 4-phosphate cytidylyltransferase n=1 Tax=Evansella alkalicola TaxID=745819 RepID=A0ABS6JP87_9BACI|nr:MULTISPECIES: 2-C-methyl-D-erythritol 4-phosphate cytidylyltransferase [Bacillaceae]MBU9720250.1 2-C-methyl-D-erythritol 4-phosphate cytidylyltransferase [Bacillus alkalicola]